VTDVDGRLANEGLPPTQRLCENSGNPPTCRLRNSRHSVRGWSLALIPSLWIFTALMALQQVGTLWDTSTFCKQGSSSIGSFIEHPQAVVIRKSSNISSAEDNR
jgi:hypothetical protein